MDIVLYAAVFGLVIPHANLSMGNLISVVPIADVKGGVIATLVIHITSAVGVVGMVGHDINYDFYTILVSGCAQIFELTL